MKQHKQQNITPIVEKVVNFYLNKAFLSKDNAKKQFNEIVGTINSLDLNKSEGELFLSRFKKWYSKNKNNALDCMDNFFEEEDFYWEEYYVGSN